MVYTILVNGMLHHIRDLRFVKMVNYDGESMECESTEGEDSELSEPGIVVEHMNSTQTSSDTMDDDDPPDQDEETCPV